MLSWQAGCSFIVSIFVVFLVYVFLGMGIGEVAANTFLLGVLGLGAIIAAGAYLSRRWGRKENQ